MQVEAIILKFTNSEDALIKSGQHLVNELDRKKYDLAFLEQLQKSNKPLKIGKDGLGVFELSKEKESIIMNFIKGILLEQIEATEQSINQVVTRFQEVSS